ncbi:hypothetical protein [Fluviicola sp.]|uniref:hypothetical protein n=1 Tax=Fluviicola sp. TaxID=1917219 RepID=UPI0026195251|nr:hypothetical protein [Fluviicola sp.]
MRLIILSIAVGLFLGSCSSTPPVKIKKGEEFTFDDQKMTVDFKASTVLVNEEDQQVLVAPEGKIYLIVDVKGQNSMYFASLKEGDKEIEKVDFLVAGPFIRALGVESPDKSDLYLVDAKGKYTIEIKSFGDATASAEVSSLKDEATVKISDRMKAFLKEFENGSGIIAATKKYLKTGVNPYDIVTENGEMIVGDPATHGLVITNIKADGTYVCSAESWYETIEVTWDGDTISKIATTSKF